MARPGRRQTHRHPFVITARRRAPLLLGLCLAAAACGGGTVDNGAFDSALAAGRPAEVTVQAR